MTEETNEEQSYTPDKNLVRMSYVDKIKRMKDYPLTSMVMGKDLSDEELNAQFDRFIGSVQADGFIAAQNNMQMSLDSAMREYAERVWADCAQWHKEVGHGVDGAGDKFNPHTLENREKAKQMWGL